eukprot:6231357-Pyramimonas_sp.AAC.1
MYTHDVARILARAWCHKMQWWYDKYLIEGDGFDRSAQAAAMYVEPDDVARVWPHAPHRVQQRIVDLRDLRP